MSTCGLKELKDLENVIVSCVPRIVVLVSGVLALRIGFVDGLARGPRTVVLVPVVLSCPIGALS